MLRAKPMNLVFELGNSRPHLDQQPRTHHRKRVRAPEVWIGEIERIAEDGIERRRFVFFPIGFAAFAR
jgi:hypothetical protein